MTLESPAGPLFASPPPDSFAGYQIVREIHRGGQGIVYQAIQKSTKKKVAIKVMKEGPFASAADQARFEREVQILGQLNHPHIVAIHDSGVTADPGAPGGVGRYHYFVMDYISGQPLDVYMAGAFERHEGTEARRHEGAGRAPGLSVESTLRLFAKICEAVNAAHVRGVIHRDLKPGNIRIDTEGEPHILDFGLAKTVMGATTNGSQPQVMTVTGQFIGSLPWASPEQAAGTPSKIDIRTDVYSLGVILYQMLTGKFPYEVVGNMRDVLDRIMHADAVRPRVASASGRRLNDEVETIVLKCLSKERDRRYQTAGELGRDIGRYLASEPIEAKRDSALYVLRKHLRRYRAVVAVAALFALLITGATVGLWILYQNQSRERERAELALGREEQQRRRADEERDRALTAQRLAEDASGIAEKQTEELRRSDYVSKIRLAQVAYDTRNIAQMKRLLDGSPEEFWGWECRYLLRVSDASCSTLLLPIATWSIALSADGRRMATAHGDNTVRIWDLGTKAQLLSLRSECQPGRVVFSPDGRRIVCYGRRADNGGEVKVWRTDTGEEETVLELLFLSNGGCAGALSPDGECLALGIASSLVVLDLRTGVKILETAGNSYYDARCIAYDPTGHWMVSGSNDAALTIWDKATGRLLTRMYGHRHWVTAVAASPDGQHVVSGAYDGSLKIWDVRTAHEVQSLPGHNGAVNEVVFSPDGRLVISCGDDKALRVWYVAGGYEIAALYGHEAAVESVAFSPDGRWIASASRDQTIKIWDWSVRDVNILRPHKNIATGVALTRDGRRALSAGDSGAGGTIVVCDTLLGVEEAALPIGASVSTSVALSCDGTRVVAGGKDGVLEIWDIVTKRKLLNVRAHRADDVAVAFSPDGRHVVSAGGCWARHPWYAGKSETTIRVWDATTGQQARVLRCPHKTQHVTYSPDGNRIAASGAYGARVWDVDSEAELLSLSGERAHDMTSVMFSATGERLVSSAMDGTIKVWDASTGEELLNLRGHDGAVNCAIFSPDGTRIISGGADGSVRVWVADTGDELLTLRGHRGAVNSVDFSPDGARIVSAGEDATVRVWEMSMPMDSTMSGRQDATLAANLVRLLFNDHILTEDVLERVVSDSTLSEGVRELATGIIRTRSDDPFELNNLAWATVAQSAGKRDRYRRALRFAESACRSCPDNFEYLNTLGAAEFRAGDFKGAVATLARSDELYRAFNRGSSGCPPDVAFVAMSLHQLGRTDEAHAALERLRALMREARWADDAEAQGFLREAEALIAGPPASQPGELAATQPSPEPDGEEPDP